MTHSNQLVILHFNDVYNVESRPLVEPVGGAARFCTAMKSFDHLNPLVLFSGDAFSPSMLSTFTKGEQMVPVLNSLRTQCAVLGNHDFDHGLEVLSDWVAKCQFPWLMSNVVDNETGRPLGDGRITHVLHWCGHRVGLLGLVEREWLDTLATINPDEVTFLDYREAGQKLAHQLRQEGCDYIIALTHMRTPNDIQLAEHCPDIDLILGGHDHVYEDQVVNGIHIIKSGTDFRQFSKITVQFDERDGAAVTPGGSGAKPAITVEEIAVTSQWEEDEPLKAELDKFTSMIEGKMDEILGTFSVPLDGRFAHIRTGESNLGNWVCDVVLASTGADLALINAGTFRSDTVHAAGPFSMRDLVNVLPMHEPLLLIGLTGRQLLETLENGVSMWPKLEGRFPQVAGISFAFDPTATPRVDPTFVRIGDEYLDLDATYRVATKEYLYSGHDGYGVLKEAQLLLDDEQCPELGLAVQNHFQAIAMRTGRTRRQSKHRQSLVTLSRRHSLVKSLECSLGDMDGPPPLRKTSITPHLTSDSTPTIHNQPSTSPCSTSSHLLHQQHSFNNTNTPSSKLTRFASLDDLEQESCALTPKLEQRIILLDSQEKRQELLLLRKRLEQGSVIMEMDECSPKD